MIRTEFVTIKQTYFNVAGNRLPNATDTLTTSVGRIREPLVSRDDNAPRGTNSNFEFEEVGMGNRSRNLISDVQLLFVKRIS